jgi:hypothetical protein
MVIYKPNCGAAREEIVTTENLLGGLLAFGVEPELGALSGIISLSEISGSKVLAEVRKNTG